MPLDVGNSPQGRHLSVPSHPPPQDIINSIDVPADLAELMGPEQLEQIQVGKIRSLAVDNGADSLSAYREEKTL